MLFSKFEEADILRFAARKLGGGKLSDEEEYVVEGGLRERADDMFAGFPVATFPIVWDTKRSPEDRPFGATSVALYRNEDDGTPFLATASVWVAAADTASAVQSLQSDGKDVIDGLYVDSYDDVDAEFDDDDFTVDGRRFVHPEDGAIVKEFLEDVPPEDGEDA